MLLRKLRSLTKVRKLRNNWLMDIKKVRKQYSLNQREFADIIGIPVGTIRNWEQGRSTIPDYLESFIDNKLKSERGINLSTIEFINLLNRLANLTKKGFKEWKQANSSDLYDCVIFDNKHNNRVVMDANINEKDRVIISYFDGIKGDKVKKNYAVNVITEFNMYMVRVILKEEKVSFLIFDGEWNISSGLY